MPEKITNVKMVYVSGLALPTKDGKILLGGSKRKFETGPAGVLGYRDEEHVVPQITAKIAHLDSLDLQAMRDSESLSVSAETTGGKMFTLVDAMLLEPPEISESGEVSLTFGGTSVEES